MKEEKQKKWLLLIVQLLNWQLWNHVVRQEQKQKQNNLHVFWNTTWVLLWFTISAPRISFSKMLLVLTLEQQKPTFKLSTEFKLKTFQKVYKKTHTVDPWPRPTCVRPLTPSEYKPHQEPDVPAEIWPEIADEGVNKASVVSSSGQRWSCAEADRSLSWPAVGHDLRHRRLKTTAGSGGESRAKAAAVPVKSTGERKRERWRGKKTTTAQMRSFGSCWMLVNVIALATMH